MHSSTSFFFSSSTFHYSTHNPNSTPPPNPHSTRTTTIPIQSSPRAPSPIPVLLPATAAATKIQAVYRSHLARTLVRRILAVDSDASRLEALIRLQDTVDAVRRDEKERLRVNEGLMALLLRLDSVPGLYPGIRALRRSVSHRIVGMQEVLDAVVEETVVGLEGFPATWEEVVYGIGGGECGGVDVEEKGYACVGIERLLSEF